MRPRITLQLINQSKSRLPKSFLQNWILECEKVLRRDLPKSKQRKLQGELVLVFLESRAAQKINQQYRCKNYATDVLSFESDSGLGELVLCPSVIHSQALQHGLSFREELGYLILHGILHLLGYDHEASKSQEIRMMRLQDRLFERICQRCGMA